MAGVTINMTFVIFVAKSIGRDEDEMDERSVLVFFKSCLEVCVLLLGPYSRPMPRRFPFSS